MTTKPSNIFTSSYGFIIDDNLFLSFLDENKIELQNTRFLNGYYLAFSFPNTRNPEQRPFVKNIGNAGLISRSILKKYMKEDIDSFIFDFFKELKAIKSVIGMKFDFVSKKYGMFELSDNYHTLYDIDNFQITYTTELSHGRKRKRNIDMFLTISFDGKTYYSLDEDELNMTIDYNNPDLFFHQVIDWHKKDFCKKLGISKNETAEHIHTIYDMLTY